MDTPSFPFERVHTDILGPLPITEKGNRYVITFQDSFTKWAITSAIPSQSAEHIATAMLDKLLLTFGAPKIMFSDNGTSYKSSTFSDLCTKFNVEQQFCAPYHKNSNGQAERLHRTLEESLSAYVNATQTDWDNYLPFITFALNTLPSATTKISPYFALFGREAAIPEDATWNTQLPKYLNHEDFTQMLQIQLNETWNYLRDRLEKAAILQKSKFDTHNRTQERQITPGDFVFIKRAPPRNKLCPFLHGPFEVFDTQGKNVTLIDSKGKKILSHKDLIRLFKHIEPSPGNNITTPDFNETADGVKITINPPLRRSERITRAPARYNSQ